MNPPMFGAVIPKSESGKDSEPATETVPLTSCALAGIWTDFVTPWRVRSPVSVTSDGVPVNAAAGTATGWVSLNVAVG